MKQPSDFRSGVEAAAKWLRETTKLTTGNTPIGFFTVELLASDMLREIADDPEGTESRTVAQIVQYLRECAMVGNIDSIKSAIARMADDIERLDWKLR